MVHLCAASQLGLVVVAAGAFFGTPLHGFAFCLCGCGSGGLLWCTLEALEHGLVLVAVGVLFVKPVRRSITWLMLEAVGAFLCSPLHSFATCLCGVAGSGNLALGDPAGNESKLLSIKPKTGSSRFLWASR